MNTSPPTIGIIGAGAWGTALAHAWASAGTRVLLWARRDEIIQAINHDHRTDALPGINLHQNITATTDYNTLNTCAGLVYALPAQVLRAHFTAHPLQPAQTLVIAAKGMEITSGELLPTIISKLHPQNPLAVLSGPNIAAEVAQGLPSASTIACAREDLLPTLQQQLSTKFFRLYPTTDVIGTACGGAIKNVIMIAAGIVEGMNLGDNARAALLTRGLAEMVRLGVAMGGNRETFMGLSGIGDLFLKSRNYRYGIALARNETKDFADVTIEGIPTAQALSVLATRLNIDMPICQTVAACLNGTLNVRDAPEALLQRPARKDERE